MGSEEEPRRVRMTPGARRVLEAAERLFYEHGIHAVGVDLIAAEAGVTKKTLYDRFGSKEQIVVEYLAGRDERWRGCSPAGWTRRGRGRRTGWRPFSRPPGCGRRSTGPRGAA